EEIPNIGPRIAADLRRLGIKTPGELSGRDPYEMYENLCRLTGQRHDPCLLDTFIAAVRFMEGAPPRPWYAYTAERKRELAARNARGGGSNGGGIMNRGRGGVRSHRATAATSATRGTCLSTRTRRA